MAPAPAFAAPVSAPGAAAGQGGVTIPLLAVVVKLPADLQSAVKQPVAADGTITLPGELLRQQLPNGSVKIPFAEVRRLAPAGTFGEPTAHEHVAVTMPLAEILARVPVSLFARRPDQRRADGTAEARQVFLNRSQTPPKPAVGWQEEKPGTAAPAAPAPFTPAPAPVEAPRPAAPVPAPFTFNSSPKPAAPAPLPAFPVLSPTAPAPLPAFPAAPAQVETVVASAPAPKPAAAVVVAPLPASAPPPSVPAGTLSVSLAAVSEAWPDAVRKEAAALGSSAALALPAEPVGAALKTGKVVFTWRQLRTWLIVPGPLTAESPNDETEVVLPLKVLAPLYMAQYRPQSHSRVPSASTPPASALAPQQFFQPVAPAPTAAPAAASPFRIPGRRVDAPAATPVPGAVAVQRLCQLPGVAGALVASLQGMVVAKQLPEGADAEALAQVIPQTLNRMNEFTAGAELGEMMSMQLATDGMPWHFAKAGTLFLAVLGRPGEALPLTQINAVTAELLRA